MPDWEKLVSERMVGLRVPPDVKEEVIAELAAHLEEAFEAACSSGMDDSAAITLALQEVKSWKALAKRIRATKSTEGVMHPITKRVLLPVMTILFAVGLTLVFLDRGAVAQRLIWISEMALLLFAAVREWDRFNQRTKSVWLPGLVSLTAASLFLFAEEILLVHDSSFYFTDMSLRPDHLVSGLPVWFYFAWLLAQSLCGAFAAYLSRRAGGSLRARVLAAAFPALVMFGLWALVIPASALAEHNTFLWNHPLYYALGIFVWVVPPAIALLAGAAPFLRQQTPSPA